MLDAAGVCPSLTAILNAYSIYCCLIAICEWMDDLETISRYGVGRGKCSSLSWRVLLSWRALVVGVNLQVSTIGGPSSRWLLPLFPFALTRDRLFWLLPLWSTPPLPQRLSLVGNAIYSRFCSSPIFYSFSSCPCLLCLVRQIGNCYLLDRETHLNSSESIPDRLR